MIASIWRKKYAQVLLRRHYLFREANGFLEQFFFEKNRELRETDTVRGQISKHIFAPQGGYCLKTSSSSQRASYCYIRITNCSLWAEWNIGSITSRCSGNEPALLPPNVLLGEGRPDTRERRKSSLSGTKSRNEKGIKQPTKVLL